MEPIAATVLSAFTKGLGNHDINYTLRGFEIEEIRHCSGPILVKTTYSKQVEVFEVAFEVNTPRRKPDIVLPNDLILGDENMPEMQKPPLGIMPESLFLEQRLHDILEAIGRYQEANMTIPSRWSDEMSRITTRMIDLQKQKEESQ